MRMKSRHWMTAVVMAIALHAGVAAAMFWPRADEGAQAPGIGGIEIALGPAGGAPGGPENTPETPDLEEQPEEPREAPPIEETAEQELPEPQESPIAEPAEPEDITERVIEPPLPAAKPTPPKEVAPEIVSEAVIAPEPPAEREPQTAGAGGKAGTQDSLDAGNSVADASAGGMAGAEADYASVLLAWLERHKEYPRAAQQRRQQGVVLLYIAMDRDGRVIDSRIQKSSGHRLLDDAALAMLERAQPLPPMPDDMRKERLEFIVPVQFFIT